MTGVAVEAAIGKDAPRKEKARFEAIDLLRGLVIFRLSILHYQHVGAMPENAGVPMPFANLLRFIYTSSYGVDFTFALSGFIFYMLYAPKIQAGGVPPLKFAVLRLSRLYPLHIVTLIAVAVLQYSIFSILGRFHFWQNNPLEKFILHLFFASDWGRGYSFSFNAPAWSLSVEVFMYIVFFAACALGWRKWWQVLALCLFSKVLSYFNFLPLSRGFFAFFLGGLCFYWFEYFKTRARRPILNIFTAICVALWVGQIWIGTSGFYELYKSHFGSSLHVMGKDIVGATILNSKIGLLYPFTIVVVALNSERLPGVLKRLSIIGNLGFSVYLLHLPLQMAFVLIVLLAGLHPSVLLRPDVFVFYLATVVIASVTSYKYFERPMQEWIRKRFLPAKVSPST